MLEFCRPSVATPPVPATLSVSDADMISVLASANSAAARPSRRELLTIGALGLGGLSLPGLLRAEQAAGIRTSHKAVIRRTRTCTT